MTPAKALTLFYAAGPGDVIGTYRHWKDGQDDPSQVSVTYSSQFFDVCRSLGAKGIVVSHAKKKNEVVDADFVLCSWPKPLPNASGIFYHLREIAYGLKLVFAALQSKADYLIVAEGTTYWFVFHLFPSSKYRVIPALHCVLWPIHKSPPSLLTKLSRRFFQRKAYATMSASEEITKQVQELTDGRARPIVPFLPTYREETFSKNGMPIQAPPFRVLFAGRIEENKGVFLLLEVAKRLRSTGETSFLFDICGTGSALDRLRESVKKAGLELVFRCHGYCDRPAMRNMFSSCHAVVVPTTTDFNEGFNQVVAESILAGRPVVTSNVCPALSYVRDAVVEVPPDDAAAYTDALLQLSRDTDLYDKKRAACTSYQSQFYDESLGWGAALRRIILDGATSI